jgi:iron(III) transport system substrate-binding protein
MKKALALVLALMMLLPLVACGGGSTTTGGSAAAASGAASGSAAASASGSAAQTVTVPTDDKYNGMTADQLLEAAKKESGPIVVYCTTSKMSKVAEAFMAEYPDLQVEVNDLDGGESITKVVTEVDSGNVLCDVVQDSDALGDVAFNYYGKYLDAYFPTDICAHIDPTLLTYGMPYYSSISYWFYNNKAFADACPVTNWWDIIETDSSGKQKYDLYMKDPGSEATYLALFSNFVAHPEELAKAYKDKYGKDVEYTYDASALGFDAENAGYEYLYRLSQLKCTFISDGDEITEAVANSTKEAPALGLASAGKIGNRDDNGWSIAWVTDLAPYVSTQNTSYVYTLPDSDHPAGSRLFIRYMLGGDDGSGDGYKAVLKEGSWSIRDDYTNDKNPFALTDSHTISSDLSAVYNHYLDVSDFWTYWHDKSPNK